MSTWMAAAYQPGTVAAWAHDILDRSREILAKAPNPEEPQSAPVLSSMEEALEVLFPDAGEHSMPLAITDRETVPRPALTSLKL